MLYTGYIYQKCEPIARTDLYRANIKTLERGGGLRLLFGCFR